MKKIGLFYGTTTVKTAEVAEKLKSILGEDQIDVVSVEEALGEAFLKYDNIILGAATWFDGELPTFWDEVIPDLTDKKFKGKKVAIFGLGNQVNYSENFVDSIGTLADLFEKGGATIVGQTSTEGYTFEQSKAVRDGKFLGLAIDLETQEDKTDGRVSKWVEQLKKEFN